MKRVAQFKVSILGHHMSSIEYFDCTLAGLDGNLENLDQC